MKIDLRKVKFFDEMSEETSCFKAEIWENGKHIADVKNDGRGGCNDIYVLVKENRAEIFDKYMKLEYEIIERADEIDQIKKLQSKNVVLGKDGKIYTSPLPMSISVLKKHKGFIDWKSKTINGFLIQGYEVLNTNL